MKFGQAFEIFGKILLENGGMNSNRIIPELINENSTECKVGVDVFEGKLTSTEEL